MKPRKVLLLEFNEITWTVIDPMIAQGRLPNFARMRREGAWGAPEALERPPHLDPWVTWVTLHTGVEREVHGATVLEQDSTTVTAKRSWDYAADAGKSVGVFGSISAYPPRPVNGFMVPGPFAPGGEVHPASLEPIQTLNRRYTRVHGKTEKEEGLFALAGRAFALFKLGLKPATCARAVRQLLLERAKPHESWRRISLQPLLNLDVFEWLYARHRPDYATFHTNHAAHYMHHYWRAYDDSGFLVRSSAEERRKFGAAVEFGYEVADELLGRFMKLVDADTVLVLASSMGQQPYVAEEFPHGRVVVRFKDVQKVLDLVGATGVTEVAPTMVPQFNVRIPDAQARARTRDRLSAALRDSGPTPTAISVEETGDILRLTPKGLAEATPVRYFFPGCPEAKPEGYALDELFICDTPTTKQGDHHPRGVLVFHGGGVTKGLKLENVSPLDIAPTMLSLLGLPVPKVMTGRVLSEVWDRPPAQGFLHHKAA
jgi:Type I phosphodiesterase / nucleotide pyrophosphatase